MHMANELLSVPVAAGTLGIAAAGLGLICRKARTIVTSDKLALMGILGAFIFAAQMVNFQLPAMPGTSGHMVGAVLLAIIRPEPRSDSYQFGSDYPVSYLPGWRSPGARLQYNQYGTRPQLPRLFHIQKHYQRPLIYSLEILHRGRPRFCHLH